MGDYLVIAFGGNAILPSGQRGTPDEQRANIRRMSGQLAQLVVAGHRVVVTHGNGPQVGEIMLKSELSRDVVPPLTLDLAGAMSQGQIGSMLQAEIGNALRAQGVQTPVVTIVSQVVVSQSDPAFRSPTKPIGRFYSADEAARHHAERGWTMVEDAGRGYRRVVPSPEPLDLVEWPAVKALVDDGMLVIAGGGGGIPVISVGSELRGVEAVIDKDLAAARLASLLAAETLVLLTEVPAVAVDFGSPQQRPLGTVSLDEMKGHYADGQFPPGSMGPKVRSAIRFLDAGGRRAIITTAENLVSAAGGPGIGTQILADQVPSSSLAGSPRAEHIT